MARQPRLAVANLPHYVIHRGHNGGAVVSDDQDRSSLLTVLRDAARAHGVAVHGYGLLGNELQLLLTPASAAALSLALQALGRRHAAVFNRRHGRSGALWDGRFRAAVLEPGAPMLLALRFIDTLGMDPTGSVAPSALVSSAGHRLGDRHDDMLTDPPEYWQLGNTPFDREAAYRVLLAEPLPAADADRLRLAVLGCRGVGSAAFFDRLQLEVGRPLQLRGRGRPRRTERHEAR
jgi:putative transposase